MTWKISSWLRGTDVIELSESHDLLAYFVLSLLALPKLLQNPPIELPYEIWLNILRFLNTETIRQLRFVDTLLYDLSIDEYLPQNNNLGIVIQGTLSMFLFGESILETKFDLVRANFSLTHRDPGNSRGVRVLLVRDETIYSESLRALESRPSFWKLIKKCSRMRHEPKTRLDRFLDAVQDLTNSPHWTLISCTAPAIVSVWWRSRS